ncbi:hypothetical protein LZ198_26735 [Myxococcus sp. K15C18031901]|uniref:hypothetical protein n=1 Tax=Myxococcus dinghuensis TaxID=2906761 RepID=UPI0020A76D97|nr:hypothetical protein [Myxococcus dinghuensis]MCP3102475.1 hypothetical protein [Myxococcus dinghuensis]
MRPLLFAGALALAPGLSLAADVVQGGAVFNATCARCHSAVRPLPGNELEGGKAHLATAPPPGVGPDLVRLLFVKSVSEVDRWVADPWAVRLDTACDTRRVTERMRADLMAFLVSRTHPAPLTPELRAQRALEQELALRKQREAQKPHGGASPRRNTK